MVISNFLKDFIYDWQQKSFRILMYHSISEVAGYQYAISPHKFNQQLEWLASSKYEIISLADALTNLNQGSIDSHWMVITFDDGYQDNWENAVSLLDKYNFKATFFVPTAMVGKSNTWDQEGLRGKLRLMDWSQLIKLSQQGHIIGSHTHKHINLEPIYDKEVLFEEIVLSKQIISQHIESDFIPFAYPYGFYNQGVVQMVKEAGYSCGLIAGGFFGNHLHTNRWVLKRESITRDIELSQFRARVMGLPNPHYVKMGWVYICQ